MTDQADLRQTVLYYWQMAKDSLESAQREFDAGATSFAVNRVYYAAFYAVEAALLERNISYSKHAGVRAALHREFVKTGLVHREWGRFYDRVFENRQQGDYLPFVAFASKDVIDEIDNCEGFLYVMSQLIESLK
ncbi:MAG: HEPN domain-containing protein [Caldilineaceae bacterium]|nr:HEPN domain-containing protein [Caldilineaceae bacterium]MBP8107756.1 HEPN domain-containing protein [Caldilineaceae bacterium]MBP8122750.1 HEPN domain-containing protein [Caldilineaceae bacterium]MBP9072938.1 HEPN domain-containing protein [Caldilineaceae bacterium]